MNKKKHACIRLTGARPALSQLYSLEIRRSANFRLSCDGFGSSKVEKGSVECMAKANAADINTAGKSEPVKLYF